MIHSTADLSSTPVARQGNSDRATIVALFVAALVIATAWVLYKGHANSRLDEEPRVGIHLAMGHGFRTSLDLSPDAELTAWVPPGYPFVTAAVFKVLGVETPTALTTLLLINAVCFALIAVAAYVLGRMVFCSRRVGLLAAIMMILHPLFILRTDYYWHTYIALAGLLWLLISALRIQRTSPRPWRLLLLGAGIGLLVQFNASFVLAAPVIVFVAVRDQRLWRQAVLAAVSVAGFVVVLAPWTIRNYVVFDRLMYVRRGAQLEVYLGNQPGDSGWQDHSDHPSVYPPENRLMLQLGEERYFALCGQRFRENYERDPAEFWWRTARRAGFMFIGESSGASIQHIKMHKLENMARVGLDTVTLVLGAAGFALAWWRGYRALWLMVLGLVSTVPYVISQVSYRFIMHIKLFLLLAGAFFLCAVWQRWRNGVWPSASGEDALA